MMRKTAILLSVLLFLGSATFGQALSSADRDKAVQYLEQTRDGVVAATKDLSEAQMKFKPAPDRWSIEEVVEHITLAEGFLLTNTEEKIMKAPAGAPDRDYVKIDTMVLAMIPDRSHKAQAPGPMVPTDRWTGAEAVDQFLKARAKTIDFLETTPDLREHVVTSPPLNQPMDAYEWILFISAHSERHTKQILEVKADPNFPKN